MNFNIRVLVLVLTLYLALSFIFINSPAVWPDEAIAAEYAFNLIHQHKLISFLHGNMYQANLGLFFYPPLLPYFLALVFKLFGFSVLVQRSTAVFFGLILLLTLIFFNSKKPNWPIAILFILDFSLIRASHFSRPEIYVLAISFLSYYVNFNVRHRFKNLGVGFLSGLCLLIHPIGIKALILNAVIYFYKKSKLQDYFVLFFFFFLATIFWLYSINFNYGQLLGVLKLQTQRRLSEPGFFAFLTNSSNDWFVRVYWLYFLLSIFFLSSFNLTKKNLKLVFLLSGLVLSWLIVFFGKEAWYYVYPLPFLYLLLTEFFNKYIKTKTAQNIFYGFLLMLIVVNLKIFQLELKTANKSYPLFVETIETKLKPNSTVFLSSVPDAYFGLKISAKNLRLYQFPPLPEKKIKYFKLLNFSDYIVYSGTLDYGFGNLLDKYIENNKQTIIPINNGPDEYGAYLIKLKPKSQRKY